jgi:hypothetical protein
VPSTSARGFAVFFGDTVDGWDDSWLLCVAIPLPYAGITWGLAASKSGPQQYAAPFSVWTDEENMSVSFRVTLNAAELDIERPDRSIGRPFIVRVSNQVSGLMMQA